MTREDWPAIVVMGAGAVGCTFGGLLARAGAPVTLIGRPGLVEAVSADRLFLDSIRFKGRVRVAASTDPAAARDAEIVLFCVKTVDTEEAARSLAPHLRKGAVVVSLQNGVDNVERIRAASGIEAVAASVYVAAEMAAPGRVKHTARGDLLIGILPGGPPAAGQSEKALERLAAVFIRAGISCGVSKDIASDLWTKLAMNCAYNALSAISRTRYGPMARSSWARALMRRAADETVAVGRACGVRMPEGDLAQSVWKLADAMPEAISSTAQDLARGRRTEIDALNGYVARRGAEMGVETPVNAVLHALVKLLEETS